MASVISVEEAAYNEINRGYLTGVCYPASVWSCAPWQRRSTVQPGPIVSLCECWNETAVVNTPGMGASVRKWTARDHVISPHTRGPWGLALGCAWKKPRRPRGNCCTKLFRHHRRQGH